MLASEIRALVAPALRDCPPECGIVAITGIELSPDASYATVVISALREPEAALQWLSEHRGSIQKNLGALRRGRIPQLRFRLDIALMHANRLDDLLRASSKPTQPTKPTKRNKPIKRTKPKV